MAELPPSISKKMQHLINMTPSRSRQAFQCPHCNTFAAQEWAPLFHTDGVRPPTVLNYGGKGEAYVAHCHRCNAPTIWLGLEMVVPQTSNAPMPAADMPDDVKADYMEARAVFDRSARAAGGLLRISLERLFPHLGVNKGNPNEAIGELVKKGLALGPLQQALDSLRIFANQSSHNGFVKLEDQPATVSFLFVLLNYIVEQMVTRPKEIDAMYKLIPQDKLDGIEKRDAKK